MLTLRKNVGLNILHTEVPTVQIIRLEMLYEITEGVEASGVRKFYSQQLFLAKLSTHLPGCRPKPRYYLQGQNGTKTMEAYKTTILSD